MQVATKRFGAVEVSSEQVLTFPEGLIGFPDYRDFVVINFEVQGDSVRWLQAVTEPALGFVALDPKAAFPDYDPEVGDSDLSGVEASAPDEVVLLSVVTVPKDIRKMTANLQAPILINPEKRLGRQVIVTSPEYTTKHYVFPALAGLAKRTG